MPRKRKEDSSNYNKVLPRRLRKLMEERNVSQQPLADYLGKSRQAISYYCDGSSAPDWENIVKIAKFFSVSTDYLLGLESEDVPTQDPTIRYICAYTGLSQEALSCLRNESHDHECISAINAIMVQNYDTWHRINHLIFAAINARTGERIKRPFGHFVPEEDKEKVSSYLEKWGGILLDSDQASAYYSEQAAYLLKQLIATTPKNLLYTKSEKI